MPQRSSAIVRTKSTHSKMGLFKRIAVSPVFANYFFFASLIVLVGSTLWWGYFGAVTHLQNADQLVNSVLFSSMADIQSALLPQAHSFLLKWPIFLLNGMLGAKAMTFIVSTMAVALLTVLSLAYILYRIEKRPLVVAALFFALSSILVLVPATPYAGALLPTNLAMLATRNIEYIVFIIGLILVIKSERAKTKRPLLAAIGLITILFASDKLFVSLSIGGALLMVMAYGIFQNWRIVRLAIRWLIVTAVSAVAAIITLWLLQKAHIVGIVSEGSTLGPYGFIRTAKDFFIGSFYALSGILTNFGANPAYDAMRLQDIPASLRKNLLSPALLGFALNLGLFIAGTVMSIRLVLTTLRPKTLSSKPLWIPAMLSIMLLAASATATIVFVVAKHAYPVDARYLAITFFAIIIASATYIHTTKLHPLRLIGFGFLCSVAVVASLFVVNTQYTTTNEAQSTFTNRNTRIAQALEEHPVSYLVGDYWRVLPITLQTGAAPTPSPLSTCTTYRTTLTSTTWQPDLNDQPFAYLLSFDKGLTDFEACNIQTVADYYGSPTTTVLIDGTLEAPKEMLLIYNQGKRKETGADTSGIVPTALKDTAQPYCMAKTTVTMVAHQDDDLLFINPGIQERLRAGGCLRTVYLTAGDSGFDKYYWLSREQGAIEAYSYMLNIPASSWRQKTVKLAPNQFAVIATPHSKPHVSLVFLRLPDGGLYNEGFESSQFGTMTKLARGQINQLVSVDKQSVYTKESLTEGLVALLRYFEPNEILTQSTVTGQVFSDHPDHAAVGNFTDTAYRTYLAEQSLPSNAIPLQKFLGYATREREANIAVAALDQKTEVFLQYAKHDGAVCNSVEVCAQTETYGNYLARQYYE